MANIGLEYTDAKMYSLLTAVNTPDKVLIGLTFKPKTIVAGQPAEFIINKVVRTLNASLDPIEFIPVNGPESEISGLYREVTQSGITFLKKMNSTNHVAGDKFEHFDNAEVNFSFFSRDAILTLLGISHSVIISGCSLKPGIMAFPPEGGLNIDYGTLKMEIDKERLKIERGSRDEQIPSATAGVPCPPWWDPRNFNIPN